MNNLSKIILVFILLEAQGKFLMQCLYLLTLNMFLFLQGHYLFPLCILKLLPHSKYNF